MGLEMSDFSGFLSPGVSVIGMVRLSLRQVAKELPGAVP